MKVSVFKAMGESEKKTKLSQVLAKFTSLSEEEIPLVVENVDCQVTIKTYSSKFDFDRCLESGYDERRVILEDRAVFARRGDTNHLIVFSKPKPVSKPVCKAKSYKVSPLTNV